MTASADDASPQADLETLANAIRALAMDAVQAANSGHPGMPMGMADVATVLFTQFLKFDAANPDWPDRDRFVLSAGHGSMLLYALLHLTGYEDMTLEELKRFRQLDSRTPGHPESDYASGIETTTGPLGQGIATAVGMALAERHLRARFGRELVDHRTFVIASDGDLMEGVSHEAASLAGHQRLDRLIVLYDDNHISIDGSTDLAFTDDTLKRFTAYGWRTEAVDGHDPAAVRDALRRTADAERPSLIACRTVIGFGSPNKAGTHGVHGSPLGPEEVEAARRQLGWPHPAFEIPAPILDAWRAVGRRGGEARSAWLERVQAVPAEVRGEFLRIQSGALPDGLDQRLIELKRSLAEEKPKAATRVLSQRALEVFTAAVPEMVGGSADLTPSNNTKTKVMESMTPEDPAARYVRYGVREHGMVAAMNGMALHGGVIPYGGTFLIFSDYCRPAIRIAALSKTRTLMVFTHDSIGLGEDGPTHQPVEHLAALRAMPGLWVLRPADGIEAAECWALALARADGPSAMILSRQNVVPLRLEAEAENLCARGGYVLREAEGPRRVTLLATGTEVMLAVEARERLQADGIGTAVVSLPCFELFEEQDRAYRAEVLGSAPRVAVEAASPFGWTRYVAAEDDVVGMTGFGASAPAAELYARFGITAEAVVARARRLLT
ncbi:MAG TPA: transketolase [Geminicoccaceae bacterium]